ncbi:MAG: YfiR family protein [Calditrichaeota bacterium]|nr:YfiR family protein [Calditrichota bacterium]
MAIWKFCLVSILFLLWPVDAFAQNIAVPVKIQYPLFLKILTFDRNLKSRVGNDIVLAVIYQSKFPGSRIVKEEFEKTFNESPIKEIDNISISLITIDIEKENLRQAISAKKIDIVYIAPLRAVNLKRLIDECHTRNILTLSGVPAYIKTGVAVGIGLKGNKPQILVNLPAVNAVNVNFSSQLLKLAKIIK